MPGKTLKVGLEARALLKEGVDLVGNAVRVTMGPKGRNVVLERRYGKPIVTNDGVTVAADIDQLANPFVNTGAVLAYEAASRTNAVAGDGTSTAAVLTQSIYGEGLKLAAAGINVMSLRRGIQKAAKALDAALATAATEIKGKKQLQWVAGLSANDPEVGRIVAEVLHKMGKDGGVNIEDGRTSAIEVEFVNGIKFDRGFISPYFAGGEQAGEVSLEKPYLLFTDQKLSAASDLLPLLEKFVVAGNKNLVVIAEDIEGEALGMLVLNRLRGVLNVVGVKAPAFGERRRWMLEDYAIFTGGKLVAKEMGIAWEKVDLSYLGRAGRLNVRKDETLIIEGQGAKDSVKRRIESIWDSHKRAKNDYDREKLSERANQLSGQVAVLRVGAPTEIEQRELKHRVEDAVSATRAALEDGVVAGGGVALIRAGLAIDELELTGEDKLGAGIVKRALTQPLMQIADNAGYEGEVVADMVVSSKGDFGFNAATGEYEDLVKAGIVDPVKVTRAAVANAVSAAIMLLTTDGVIADSPEE